jgi:hypothetical protein
MRRTIAAVLAAAAASVALAACGNSTAPANSAAAGNSPAAGESCHAQFEAWRHGPARTAGKAFVAQFRAVKAAGEAEDVPRLVATLKAAGRGVTALEAYPMPKCADPHGYWRQFLTRIRAAADNASTGNGLGALLLAITPLKPVPGILTKLSAELKQTAGVTQAFGSGAG